jgi:hypothetical protein
MLSGPEDAQWPGGCPVGPADAAVAGSGRRMPRILRGPAGAANAARLERDCAGCVRRSGLAVEIDRLPAVPGDDGAVRTVGLA